jgi:hypothetical protein
VDSVRVLVLLARVAQGIDVTPARIKARLIELAEERATLRIVSDAGEIETNMLTIDCYLDMANAIERTELAQAAERAMAERIGE